ncbi:amino acid decarboxylase [Phyllobacterium salinisoli]|uniref:Amino acid decarboxylase n=1 Tax=Phyllobacterium salinisoli TaxID=1899321 RepID=A0A368JZJ8_9HYPH|nr:pyridoxal-dependent decarboxylase [Phyllobacterium salinisoli]RCS21845.1 amino acid decarboxylase [Phyllobacterium salinisoli]
MDAKLQPADTATEETLDPADWSGVERIARRLVGDAIVHLRDVRQRPAWREMPRDVQSRFREPLPEDSLPLEAVLAAVTDDVMPYPMGNVHPRFWAWYMGSGNLTGAFADFLAAIQGSNLGGGNHAAALVDLQVVDWCKQMVGFPATASGTLTSGGSVANLIGLTVARNAMADIDIRELGVAAAAQPLRFYGSDQIHSCHRKTVEALGLGNRALRRIATGPDFRIDISALTHAIEEDRASGFRPACIIANARSVNTGALDDLEALADLADEQNLWFHVDGCIGALIAIAPRHRSLVAGLHRADSLALDPHKWLHAPFDVGCCLVKNAAAHRGTFATTPEYLESASRGLASGEWLHEYCLQTSRGFRALKVWMALKEHGVNKFGRLIDQNIDQAHYLARLIEAEPNLSLMATTTINIVCFRYDPGGLDEPALKALNTEIMLQLQEDGLAVLSDTTLRGRHCLRAAIGNHRTRCEDIDLLVAEIVRRGKILSDGS